jgi:hypothetical protein
MNLAAAFTPSSPAFSWTRCRRVCFLSVMGRLFKTIFASLSE